MAEDERPGLGGFFSSFANAMLERGLPALREWVRERLGPRASLGAVELEGTTVRVRDARIPLGASMILEVREALLAVDPEDLMAGRTVARLERLEGVLIAELRTVAARGVGDSGEAPGARRPPGTEAELDGEVAIRAPLTLRGRPGGAPWVDADLELRAARFRAGDGYAEPALDGRARVVVTAEGWRIDDATLGAIERPALRGHARGPIGRRGELPSLALEAQGVHAGTLLDVFAALSGRAIPRVPRHALVEGRFALGGTFGLQIDARLTTRESELAIAVDAAPTGELRSASARGTLAWRDLPIPSIDPSSEALTVRARGHGRVGAIRGTVELACARLEAPWLKEPGALAGAVALMDEDAVVSLDVGGLGHVRAEARIDASGALTGTGAARIDPAPLALVFGLAAQGAALDVPLEIGGTRSAPVVRARAASPALTIRGDDEPGLSLRRLRVDAVIGHHAHAPRGAGGDAARAAESWLSIDARARTGPGQLIVKHASGQTRVLAERVDAASVRAAMGMLGAQTLFVPASAQLWADVLREASGRLEGALHVETAASRLSVAPLVVDPRAGFDGTRVTGTIAIAELVDARVIPGPWIRASDDRVELEGELRGPRSAPLVELALRAPRVGLLLGGFDPLVLTDVATRVRLGTTAFEIRALDASLFGGRLAIRGARYALRAGDDAPFTFDAIEATGLSEGLGRWILRGRPGLEDLALDVRVGFARGAPAAEIHARTMKSSLRGALAVESGGTIEGTVSTSDLAPWVSLDEAPITLTLTLEGALRSPRATIHAALGATALRLGAARIPIDSLRVDARAGEGRLAWERIEARLLGGRVRSRGVLARGEGFRGLVADLHVDDVAIGEIGLGDRGLREWIDGSLSASLRVFGRGRIGAKGDIELASPRYALLALAAPMLARYGLPLPPLDGDAPARAEIVLEAGAWTLREARASVPGVRVSAGAGVADGALDGELLLSAERSWLERSRLLQLPARVLGGVTVPIRLEGELGAWRARPDLMGALRYAIDRLVRDVAPPLPALPAHAPTSLLGTDALIDRVAEDADDADAAIEALLERGLSPDEIAARVARRR